MVSQRKFIHSLLMVLATSAERERSSLTLADQPLASPQLSVAVRYGGFTLSVILTVAGFALPVPEQLGWASWIRRISPFLPSDRG